MPIMLVISSLFVPFFITSHSVQIKVGSISDNHSNCRIQCRDCQLQECQVLCMGLSEDRTRLDPFGDITSQGLKHWSSSLTPLIERESTKQGKSYTWLSMIERWEKTIILVYANKQDLPESMKPEELQERLGLTLSGFRNRTWVVQPCCATTGDGLYEGLTWLMSQSKKT